MDDVMKRIFSCLEVNGIETSANGSLENMDSVTFISMVVDLETEFNIFIPDEYLLMEKMNSVEQLQEIVLLALEEDC